MTALSHTRSRECGRSASSSAIVFSITHILLPLAFSRLAQAAPTTESFSRPELVPRGDLPPATSSPLPGQIGAIVGSYFGFLLVLIAVIMRIRFRRSKKEEEANSPPLDVKVSGRPESRSSRELRSKISGSTDQNSVESSIEMKRLEDFDTSEFSTSGLGALTMPGGQTAALAEFSTVESGPISPRTNRWTQGISRKFNRASTAQSALLSPSLDQSFVTQQEDAVGKLFATAMVDQENGLLSPSDPNASFAPGKPRRASTAPQGRISAVPQPLNLSGSTQYVSAGPLSPTSPRTPRTPVSPGMNPARAGRGSRIRSSQQNRLSAVHESNQRMRDTIVNNGEVTPDDIVPLSPRVRSQRSGYPNGQAGSSSDEADYYSVAQAPEWGPVRRGSTDSGQPSHHSQARTQFHLPPRSSASPSSPMPPLSPVSSPSRPVLKPMRSKQGRSSASMKPIAPPDYNSTTSPSQALPLRSMGQSEIAASKVSYVASALKAGPRTGVPATPMSAYTPRTPAMQVFSPGLNRSAIRQLKKKYEDDYIFESEEEVD